jgi:8-oxo-dGTP diphosphatase
MKHRRPPAVVEAAPPSPDEDARFLATYDASAFERPSVAVDVALVTVHDGALATLLLRRAEPPQRGRHALPGAFVRLDEALDAAAARALAAKTGVEGVFLEQLYTFGAPGRDPRTRVISVAYYALVDAARFAAAAPGTVVARLEVPWDGEEGGPVAALGEGGARLALAFDHAEILGAAVKRLRGKLAYSDVGFELLPPEFTIAALKRVHEAILGAPLNKDSFRRKMIASGRIEATGRYEEAAQHRPAELHRFRRDHRG